MSSRNFILKIGGSLDPSLNKSLSKGRQEINKLGQEMLQMKKKSRALNQARSNSKKLEAQFKKSNDTYIKSQKEAEKLAEKIEELRTQVNGSEKANKAATIEFKKALQTQKQLAKRIDKSKEETREYSEAMNKAKSQVWMLSEGEEKLNEAMAKNLKLQEKIIKRENLNKNRMSSGKERMKKMVAPALMVGAGVKFAIDDEAAFADVRKQLKTDDPVEIENFRKELLKTTKGIPLMNREIYEIAAAAGQAGIAQKDLATFTADTAKVAVAFGVDADKSGKTLSTWRTSLNMTQDEVMGLADQINTLSENINATPEQISDIVTSMGQLGKEVNFTEAQTAALGGTLLSLGTKDASTASTAIRKLYSALSSGQAASGSRKTAYEILGFDPADIAKELQEDSAGTLNKVLASFNNLDESRRMSVGTMLFGEESVGALLPLVNQLDKINNNLNLVNDKTKTANSVNNEFNNINGTASAQLKILMKSLLNLGLAFSNHLLPPLKYFIGKMNSGVQTMTALAQKFPGLTQFLTIATTGFIGVNLAIGAATFGIGALGTAFTVLSAHPIILGISVIAAGLYSIYKIWKKMNGEKKKQTLEVEERINTKNKSYYTGNGKKTTLEVDGFASGGVVRNPQLAIVGEGGSPESIIPHDNSRRSKNLWFETGKSLGMFGKDRVTSALDKANNNILKNNYENKNEISITFAPVLKGGGDVIEQLKSEFPKLTELIEDAVEKALSKNQKMDRRLSLG
jgi:TP901 family phage tail tape measure protein